MKSMNNEIENNAPDASGPTERWTASIILAILYVLFIVFAIGAADAPAPDATAAPPVLEAAIKAIPPTGNGILDKLLGALGPTATTILTVIGVLRVVFKPIFTMAHSVTAATPTTRDDVILAKIEASAAYKAVAWIMDYLASVKLGPAKPVPAVLNTTATKDADKEKA